MKNTILTLSLMVMALLGLGSCNDTFDNNDQGLEYGFRMEQTALNYAAEGGTLTLNVASQGSPSVSSDAAWVTITPLQSGSSAVHRYEITAAENTDEAERTATITVTSTDGQGSVKVTQKGVPAQPGGGDDDDDDNYPLPNDGVNSDAPTLIAKIGIGWNLGNSLEAIGGETAWGNPKTTRALISAVKEAGFNAVRIPCAWDSYIDDRSTYHISDTWMQRVKQVVNYCVSNGMYVILNSHWDNGWLETNPYADKKDEVNAEQRAIWTQIANTFKDYDEHLMFAGCNEVHLSDYSNPNDENRRVQESYLQTFIDAVRATGGNNAQRVLVVQSFNTNINEAANHFIMPTDAADKRLVLEVHYYDPYNFCLNTGDGMTSFWGKDYASYGIDFWGQEEYMLDQINSLKSKFVDAGVPVVIGEYGANRRNLSGDQLTAHLASRAYWYKTFNSYCADLGIKTFAWDAGGIGNNNSMGLFNRNANTVIDQQCIDAIKQGSER